MAGRLRNTWRAARRSLGYGPVARFLTVRENDVFLVSYPRSGNTWLRFILANLAMPSQPADFLDIERRVPDIYVHSDRTLLRLAPPRLLKSHEYYDPRYGRVVYVVRDPRDVAPSYYRWQLTFGSLASGYRGEDYLQRFLDGSLDPFGSWQSHVGGWLGALDLDASFCVVQYEDMVASPLDATKRISEFLGFERSQDQIQSAVERSGRDRMRELERSQRQRSSLLRGRRSDIPFVGAGSGAAPIDAQEEYLRGEEARHRIEERFARVMTRLGYLTGSAASG